MLLRNTTINIQRSVCVLKGAELSASIVDDKPLVSSNTGLKLSFLTPVTIFPVSSIIPNDWANRVSALDYLMPKTPEEYYYRFLFTSMYGLNPIAATVPYRWMPKWSPETTDPSARTLAVYDE